MGFKQFLQSNWRLINANNLLMNRLNNFKSIVLHFFINFCCDKEIIIIVLLIRCVNSGLESQGIGYAQKSVVNKLQLPQKPKKPNPPFFQYLKEKRQEVTKSHNLSPKGINFF